MKFNMKMIIGLIFISQSFVVMAACPIYALVVREAMITDVTPSSFCVCWLSDEETLGQIELYQDHEGLYPVASYNIIQIPCPDEEIFNQAAKNGIVKIKAEGLSKNNTYYFKLFCTSASDPNRTVIYPLDNSLLQVTTELAAGLSKPNGRQEVRLKSNLLVANFYHEDKFTPAENSLVIAMVEGASYPISAYIGDCVPSPSCVIDLYNLFDQTQHTTMEAGEGSEVIFYNYKGTEQTTIRKFFLPQEVPEAEPITPVGHSQQISLAVGLNYFSFQVDPQNSAQIHTHLNGKYTEFWTFKNGSWVDLSGDVTCTLYPNQGYLITATEACTDWRWRLANGGHTFTKRFKYCRLSP